MGLEVIQQDRIISFQAARAEEEGAVRRKMREGDPRRHRQEGGAFGSSPALKDGGHLFA